MRVSLGDDFVELELGKMILAWQTSTSPRSSSSIFHDEPDAVALMSMTQESKKTKVQARECRKAKNACILLHEHEVDG